MVIGVVAHSVLTIQLHNPAPDLCRDETWIYSIPQSETRYTGASLRTSRVRPEKFRPYGALGKLVAFHDFHFYFHRGVLDTRTVYQHTSIMP